MKFAISKQLQTYAVAVAAAALVTLAAGSAALADGTSIEDQEIWKSIATDLYGDNAKITETDTQISLDAPYRALDAAIVPLKMTIPAEWSGKVKRLTLVVDKNPAPVVARFEFGKAAGLGERSISTRVRVDMYSNVRAIAEMKDGSLFMTTKYVKAAGGCSAPALKDMDAALDNVGKMKIRHQASVSSSLTEEAQVMIRHPNYSGMQMNQVTGFYIPAKFVEHIEVRKGKALVFKLTGGISLSEDPNIRFTYASGGNDPLHVSARDTDGKVFEMTAKRVGS
ncbi:MAG: quinoprotein dehydrogenase-associated SoxYZ-like carrier [Pseudomonadota bacterium]